MDGQAAFFKETGMDGFIAKPAHISEVTDVLRRHLPAWASVPASGG